MVMARVETTPAIALLPWARKEVVAMVDSKISALDAINSAVSDLRGAADALSLRASDDGDDLASMLSRVLDVDVDALREVAGWLSE